MPKRILTGVVTSEPKRTDRHRVRGASLQAPGCCRKTIRKSKKYRAHDENKRIQRGRSVRIIECAPKSKTKRWEVSLYRRL